MKRPPFQAPNAVCERSMGGVWGIGRRKQAEKVGNGFKVSLGSGEEEQGRGRHSTGSGANES